MRGIIALLSLAVIVLVPVWFIGSTISLFVSPAQRTRVRTHLPNYVVLGLGSLLVLGIVWSSFMPKHLFYPSAFEPDTNVPVTPGSVAQADTIVEGSFDSYHVVSMFGETLAEDHGPGLRINCFIVPFHVESWTKRNPGRTIPVKIFFPADKRGGIQRGGMQWELPLREKMLLLLQRDPEHSGTYELLSQQTSWLVIAHPHEFDSSAVEAGKFIVDDAKGFLNECASHPELPHDILYLADIGSSFTQVISRFPMSDPAREHALEIVRNLAKDDPDLPALAARFTGEDGKVGILANRICADAGDTSALQARLEAFNREPPATDSSAGGFQAMGRFNFPGQVASVVQDSDNLGRMMPVICLAVASPDQRMRLFAVRALGERQRKNNWGFEHGNQLGNQFYPLLVKLLDDPDRQVQYAAMGCIFEMSGCIRQRAGHRDLDLWATDIVRQNPDFYVAQYKAWWEKHKSELAPPSP